MEDGSDSIGAGGGVAGAPLAGASARASGRAGERLQLQTRSCRVVGCASALEPGYSMKYKICGKHAVVASLEIDGQACRFCQQCARFQPVAEFDNDRRSCRASLEGHRQRRQDKRRKSQSDGAAPAQPRAHQGAGSASDLAAADTAESAEQTGGEGTRQQRGKRQRQESRSVQEAEPAPAVAAAAVAPAQGSDAAAAEQQSMQQLAEHLPSVVQQLVQLVQQATEHQGALPPPKQQAPPPQQQPPIAPRLPFGGQQQAAVPQASTAAPAATAPPLQLAAQQTQLAPPPPLPPQLPHHQGAHRLAPPPSSLPESRLFGAFLGQQLAVQQGLQQGVNMLRAPQLPAALVKELTELRGGLTGGGRLPPRADLVSEALRLLRTEQGPATGWADVPSTDELAAFDSLLGIDLSNPAARAVALHQAMRLAQQGGMFGTLPPGPGGPPGGGPR
ncbi:squamosa promoter-binding 13A isoform A [Micractinium conductrix]|uniref:Squamosa promoter-binding 13A isoform A n=1 Tax=Micractinium conductrix TaxID=554055 RepID=A0A2P6VE62_9CHLO|nr:squamosa promoter-binding 13A isoform A [Micractinium conductrix]|eukprot:PSC72376.1 squamosa promoter-binding 13A isoform A [Micractinium conductrix]